jgi:hypothetical protein
MARPTKYYELEDQFAQVIEDLELYTYYQLLEVEPSASADVVLYNYNMKVYEYEQLQKDRWCGPVLHQNLELLKKRLDEAREVLCDLRLKLEYNKGLDEGQTRHVEVASRREQAVRAAARPDPKTAVDVLAAKLERTLHHDLIHAGEEVIPDEPSEGIDEALVEQSLDLKQQVQEMGVELEVKEEEQAEEIAPIDVDYLEEAAQHLVGKLIVEHDLTLHEQVEEDVSADAAFASELTDGLRGELYKMGVSEWEEHEADGEAPDAETIDRILAAEQDAVAKLGVKTTVKRDEGLHEFVVDQRAAEAFAAGLEGKLAGSGLVAETRRERSLSERAAALADPLPAASPAGVASALPAARPVEPQGPVFPTYFKPEQQPEPMIDLTPFEEPIAIDEPAPAPSPVASAPRPRTMTGPLPLAPAPAPVSPSARARTMTGPLPLTPAPRSPVGNATGPQRAIPEEPEEEIVPIIPIDDE